MLVTPSHVLKQTPLWVKVDLQSGVSDGLAGDVSLNLGLVDAVDTYPNKCSSNSQSPKRVSPQRVCIEADDKGNYYFEFCKN